MFDRGLKCKAGIERGCPRLPHDDSSRLSAGPRVPAFVRRAGAPPLSNSHGAPSLGD